MDTVIIELTKGFSAIVDAIDADLGAMRWCCAGRANQAARRNKDGNRAEYMHRVIVARMLGRDITKEHVEHINGNPLDNRRANLRLKAKPEYKPKLHVSRYEGVYWYHPSRLWEASIAGGKKIIYVGLFDTQEQAHSARCEAIKQLQGE